MEDVEFAILYRFYRDSEKTPFSIEDFQTEFRTHEDFFNFQKHKPHSIFWSFAKDGIIESTDGTSHDKTKMVITKLGRARYEYEKSVRDGKVSENRLTMEKLNLEVQSLRNTVLDYNKVRGQAKKALCWSIVAAVATALTWLTMLLQWKCGTPD